jgi:hypothetical protein
MDGSNAGRRSVRARAPGIAISQSMIEQTVLPSTNCRRTVKLVTALAASAAIAR